MINFLSLPYSNKKYDVCCEFPKSEGVEHNVAYFKPKKYSPMHTAAYNKNISQIRTFSHRK